MKNRARIASGLAALAAFFLAPLAEASHPRATSPPLERPALAVAAPAPEPSEFSLFEGTELVRAAAEPGSREGFHPLAAVSLLDERVQRALATPLEASYPKTRYRVFEILGTPILGVERGVSLELRWGCTDFSCGLASGTVGWLSEDPLGDKDSPNLYAFVGARPHEKTDPLGLLGDTDPRSNPDVAEALATAQAAKREAFERERKAFNKGGGRLRAIQGNELRGAVYYGIDYLLPFGLSNDQTTFHPFAGAGQAPADYRAFVEKHESLVTTAEVTGALVMPGKALKLVGVGLAISGHIDRVDAKKPELYEVDTYENLRAGDVPGDQLGNHHVPQRAPARIVVPGYPQDKTAASAPAIRLPDDEHLQITAEQARRAVDRAKMTPRQLLADDLRMLRQYSRAPRAALKKVSEMAKQAYQLAKP